jgi:phosphopantetheinyl transferase (holo-ACP synthase)
MIGNDIIDIRYTKLYHNFQRIGYLQKIYTKAEQELINTSHYRFYTVWRLWSMKESAYKSFIKEGNAPFFNPVKLRCSIENNQAGYVNIGSSEYKVQTIETDDYIFSHTIDDTRPKTSHKLISVEKSDSDYQSITIYNTIIAYISKRIKSRDAIIEIIKDKNGAPSIYVDKLRLDIDLSITHHGNYAAYSIGEA